MIASIPLDEPRQRLLQDHSSVAGEGRRGPVLRSLRSGAPGNPRPSLARRHDVGSLGSVTRRKSPRGTDSLPTTMGSTTRHWSSAVRCWWTRETRRHGSTPCRRTLSRHSHCSSLNQKTSAISKLLVFGTLESDFAASLKDIYGSGA